MAQWGNALDLWVNNRLRVSPRDLALLASIPPTAGLILVLNHADETDIRVCMEIARRARRRFTYMINAEAFEERRGFAGWWLQRLGAFSVRRGAADQAAFRHAIERLQKGGDALVIFPEGEIYYLNELIQPFKTGAVRFGLQALADEKRRRPGWTVYVLPVAIRYRFRASIEWLLHRRIRRLENHLFIRSGYLTLQQKLAHLMAERLRRQIPADRVRSVSEEVSRLSERVREVRGAIVSAIASKYPEVTLDPAARLRDQAGRLLAFLQEQMRGKRLFSPETRSQFQRDIQDLKRTIQLVGWHPPYAEMQPSEERLAETVMKLEREVFGAKRPKPLGPREVLLRIGAPKDLREALEAYREDPFTTCKNITESLQKEMQVMIEQTTEE